MKKLNSPCLKKGGEQCAVQKDWSESPTGARAEGTSQCFIFGVVVLATLHPLLARRLAHSPAGGGHRMICYEIGAIDS